MAAMVKVWEDGSGFIQWLWLRVEWDAFDSIGDTVRIVFGS